MLRLLHLEVTKEQDVHWFKQIIAVVLALLVALFFSGLLIAVSGANPFEAFYEMYKGAFGSTKNILETLLRSSPLLLAGLATVIAFRGQIWSIGQEGQLLAGAMAAYFIYSLFVDFLPQFWLLVVIILGGFIGGAILGGIAGLMKSYANVDIIISTVLLNYIIANVLSMLLYDHKYWMGANTYYPRTDPIAEIAFFPTLFEKSRLHIGFPLAVALALLVYWLFKRTPYGYDIRALGANPIATRFRGIDIKKLVIITMLFSGGIAGLAGAGEVFGVHHYVTLDISPGYGYTGIIVAMVAELNPIITILVAIIFGGLINGSVRLITTVGTHTSIIYVIQAFVLLSILASRALIHYRIRRVSRVD